MLIFPLIRAAVKRATATFTASSVVHTSAKTNWAGEFDGLSIGTASADRIVVVGISGNNNSSGVPSAVTIGGNSATLAGSTYLNVENDSSIWYAAVASGTTADIDITYSAAKQTVGVAVYAITGASGGPSATSGDTTDDAPSTTINVLAKGCLIACASHAVGGGTLTTWTGPSEDYDDNSGGGNSGFTAAHENYSAAQTGLTVTATADGAAVNSSMACAAWGPA